MLNQLLKQSFNYFKEEWALHRLHQQSCKKAKEFQDKNDLKLHLACGVVYKKGWVNIDLDPKMGDLTLDLTRPLPFADNSCEEIWSEHFLEHIAYPGEARAFLGELYRITKPGGKVTTIVPDTAWPMESYFKGYDAEYFKISKERNWHPREYSTPMEHINYHFRQGTEHKFAYDEETLKKVLKEVGFAKNTSRDFDPSIDYEHHHPGSLYVVSQK